MTILLPSKKIYIASSLIVPQERGVFARVPMKKGEIIEVCPLLTISPDDTAAITEESLLNYMFYFGKKKEYAMIALGCGSLYNHSHNPNSMYTIQFEENVMQFSAIQDIQKDEEITIRYTEDITRKLWFEK